MQCKYCKSKMYLSESEDGLNSEINHYFCEECESVCCVTTWCGGDETYEWARD